MKNKETKKDISDLLSRLNTLNKEIESIWRELKRIKFELRRLDSKKIR